MGRESDRCWRLEKALTECHKRMGSSKTAACRHLNRGLAECFVSIMCPDECEAVASLCSSGGTALKRSQCQQAQLSLSITLRAYLPIVVTLKGGGEFGLGKLFPSSKTDYVFLDFTAMCSASLEHSA
ncbi:hypothetical protein ACFE04_029683 [Oxalis oulophora]